MRTNSQSDALKSANSQREASDAKPVMCRFIFLGEFVSPQRKKVDRNHPSPEPHEIVEVSRAAFHRELADLLSSPRKGHKQRVARICRELRKPTPEDVSWECTVSEWVIALRRGRWKKHQFLPFGRPLVVPLSALLP